jgi:predicted peptidase
MRMISIFRNLLIVVLIYSNTTSAKNTRLTNSDDVSKFKTLLKSFSNEAQDDLFALHYQSIIDIIESKSKLSSIDSSFISQTLPVFSDETVAGFAGNSIAYLERIRPLTIAWESPTDGVISFFRLKLPKDWDPKKTYPLYVDLHGLTSIANNPIEYMTNYYRVAPTSSFAFEDGYHLSPWARGNFWYQGISETDVWEAIDVIEKLVKIDPARKYLMGHSMGGYGAWLIASNSAKVWAAIGIHAGALWYGNNELLQENVVQKLAKVPTYIVVGTQDGLYTVDQQAYHLLQQAGNQNIEFVSFEGGHEKLPVNVENMYLWLKEFVNTNVTKSKIRKNILKNQIQFCPNPILTETTIFLNIENSGSVKLNLIDIDGQHITTILDEIKLKGKYYIKWNAGEVNPGVYVYTAQIGNEILKGKLVIK